MKLSVPSIPNSDQLNGAAPSVASSDQAEVDHLLDKIAANGYESLTADEKRRLKEASERLRRERG